MSRLIASLLLTASLMGCRPANPPPAGFVESCYGGDFAKYHDGNAPRVSVRIALTEGEWPSLAGSLQQFSDQQRLDYFDTSGKREHVHSLGSYVCSARGVFIMAMDDVWKGYPQADADPDHTTVLLYRYKGFDSSALEEALILHLHSSFPESIVTR